MVNIIPAARQYPSGAEKFSEALGNVGNILTNHLIEKNQKEFQEMMHRKENDFFKHLTGQDISGISNPKMREAFLDAILKEKAAEKSYERDSERDFIKQNDEYNRQLQKQEHERMLQNEKHSFEKELNVQKNQSKEQEKFQKNLEEKKEKEKPFESALKTIQEMRSIGRKGNLGRGSSLVGFFGGETAKDKGKYEQLGKSLISMASTIRITNRPEFETLSKDLFDSSLPDDAREGILDAMELIIKNSLSESEGLQELSSENAKEYTGKVVEDENGIRYRSNGTEWVRE